MKNSWKTQYEKPRTSPLDFSAWNFEHYAENKLAWLNYRKFIIFHHQSITEGKRNNTYFN